MGLAPQVIEDCIGEFYATTNASRRHELDNFLCGLKSEYECGELICVCMYLLDQNKACNVRYFGAITLYDTIRHKYEDLIALVDKVEELKLFLMSQLETAAHLQSHSITNKLSATLALVALYSIPDIWSSPVQDLTLRWAGAAELLLRVLAEFAAEFANVQMPLGQRSILKAELHRVTPEVTLIIKTVLNAMDTTPSIRQAAVDCVEQWIQLPNAQLDQWTDVLSVVFAAVSEDSAALTNILNILAGSEDLQNLETLVLDVSRYITHVASQKIGRELTIDNDNEELTALVSAVCSLCECAVPVLVKYGTLGNIGHLLDVCNLLVKISTCSGSYPLEEGISELPAVFWTTLRENVLCNKTPKLIQVIDCLKTFYANISQAAIAKLSFLPTREFEKLNKIQIEQFATYRENCSEIPVDAYLLVGNEILNFLNTELQSKVSEGDVCRVESILYQWELVGDYLSEKDYPMIEHCLQVCSSLTEVPPGTDGDRLGNTLMRMLFTLSHLIQEHDNASALEQHVVSIIISFLSREDVIEEGLRTLEKFVANPSNGILSVGEEISQVCYGIFNHEKLSSPLRLLSLKCIGYVIANRDITDVMTLVNQIIEPQYQKINPTHVTTDANIQDRLFLINMFASLFSTLRKKKYVENEQSAVVLILKQSMDMFRLLSHSQGSISEIGDKICEAIRSAVCYLSSPELNEVYDFVAEVITQSLISNASSACSLAKSTVLIYSSSDVSSNICCSLAEWFKIFDNNLTHGEMESWIAFVYQVVKKDWKMLRAGGDKAFEAIGSSIGLASKMICTSNEPNVVRLSAQVLASISTQATSYDDEVPRQLLATQGPVIVKAIYYRLQSEVNRTTVEALAEVFYFFSKQFTMETRAIISSEDCSESAMIASMFSRDLGNIRKFKLSALRFNQACRKSKS